MLTYTAIILFLWGALFIGSVFLNPKNDKSVITNLTLFTIVFIAFIAVIRNI